MVSFEVAAGVVVEVAAGVVVEVAAGVVVEVAAEEVVAAGVSEAGVVVGVGGVPALGEVPPLPLAAAPASAESTRDDKSSRFGAPGYADIKPAEARSTSKSVRGCCIFYKKVENELSVGILKKPKFFPK